MKRSGCRWGLFLGCLMTAVTGLLPDSTAEARMSVASSITLREEYTDNVFLDPFREQDDLISTLAPSLILGLDNRLVTGELTYGLEFRKYLDHDGLDETALKDIQRGQMDLILLPTGDFSILAHGIIDRVVIDDRREISDRTSLVNKTNRSLVRLRPQYRRNFTPTLTGELAFPFDKTRYESSAGDDTQGYGVELLIEKSLSPRLDSDLKGTWSRQKADLTEDYRRLDLTLGCRWNPNPAWGLTARGGAIQLDYDHRDAAVYGLGTLELTFGESKPWQLVLLGSQDYLQSADDGLKRRRNAELRLVREARLSGELVFYQLLDNFQAVDREDRYYGGRMEVGYRFSRALEGSLRGHYRYQKYLPENERGHRYGGGGELAFSGKIYRIAVGYTYTENTSSISANSYRENLVYLEGHLTFGTRPPARGEK